MPMCPWCWTCHGCELGDGHKGDHVCRLGHPADQPEIMPRGAPGVFHAATFEPEIIRSPT